MRNCLVIGLDVLLSEINAYVHKIALVTSFKLKNGFKLQKSYNFGITPKSKSNSPHVCLHHFTSSRQV